MGNKLEDRFHVLRSILPVLGLNGQEVGVQLVGCHALTEDVEDDTSAKAQLQRVGRDGTSLVGTTGTQLRVVIHLDATELTSIGVEFGKAVEPQRRMQQFAIEVEHACPHVGIACVVLLDGRQRQDSITLLHQPHVAGKGTALHVAGVVDIVDERIAAGIVTVGSLHPRRYVEGSHKRFGPVGNADFGIVGFADNDVLPVIGRSNGTTVGNLRTTSHREWRWSYGDTFQLTDEVTGVRRLIVAYALPYHALTILMVVPERIVAILGGDVGRVDADVFVVGSAGDDFLAPVAKDVACCRRGVLGPVAVGGAISSEHDGAISLEHARSALSRAGSVESFLKQVAVPVDAEIIGESAWAT